MLLYATYSEWSYEPAEQLATSQEYSPETARPKTRTADTNQATNTARPPNTNGVLGLSDAIPTISKNNPVEDTASPPLRTDVIKNNVLELHINPNKGADIVGAKLMTYHPTKKETDTPVELLSLNTGAYHYFQTGLISVLGGDEANHTRPFKKLSSTGPRDNGAQIKYAYDLVDDAFNTTGIRVIKTYRLKEDSFRVDLEYEIINNSNSNYEFVQYAQLVKKNAEVE